ncbi:MAG TPA: hypothetical protein VLA93_16280 [Pyrinomonadaceae bacterium]|nr:hypothetical protein [Pyrinomonadaceae bacterium]
MNTRRNLAADRRRRKLITFGWSLALLLVVVVLIAFEKTAILYILATLGVTAILMVVAFADLDHKDAGTLEESSAKGD